ncbi:toxin biosynthesis protein [Aaosphaeria arxii CBS 175.79]|uniref:Toxin biosynthesis protein n=1 Tax=Aaosphaeria arxii CBS 175.79 TaxID=1450172 RepID=A0A6A5XZ51_9PLEO|nr:toxin biosynthesis protein [Aaosphaeria arxii CBS 175.79]KAF2017910.1 toxin biosynthesis protein [Aaosphaeria arxii CBS 175.79]
MMTSSSFDIKEHVIPCQHIRGYRHASKDQTVALQLAVKQYTPKRVLPDDRPAVTVIGLHANGIPKEAYEPLWEDFAAQFDGNIRNIWIADCAHQGASGILNEGHLGDDPNWFDHSRDLLGMVNHFRNEIQAPVIGVAHSMGCAQLVQLSQIHPTLFQSLVLIEPVIQETIPPGPNAGYLTSYRPDFWQSKEEAHAYFDKNKFYKSLDPRCFERYLQYGLRSTPTALFPTAPPGSVTLSTTKHQEAWSFIRSIFPPRSSGGEVDMQEQLLTSDYGGVHSKYVFHRPEAVLAFRALSTLQPAVYWIFAEQSYINPPKSRNEKVRRTGAEIRGRGGVTSTVVAKSNHNLPLTQVTETASLVASHIVQQLKEHKEQQEIWDRIDTQKSDRDQQVLSSHWMKAVRNKSDTERPMIAKNKL